MIRKRRLAVAAVALAALGLTGTAATAAGAAPAPGSAKTAAITKFTTPDADLIAAASALGVTPDALLNAMDGAKQSFATATGKITNADFIAAVADRLGLPVASVGRALDPMINQPGKGAQSKSGGPAKDGNPADSPFATTAAAEALAASTGVTVDKAHSALMALLQLSAVNNGLEPTSPAYRAIAAGLGITTDQLTNALGHLKQSLSDS